MTKSSLAALFAVAVIVVPLAASSAPDAAGDSRLAQANAPAAGSPAAPAADPDRAGMNPMMRHGMMHGMHGMMMQASPQQRCINKIARRAGFRAYIGVKLNLTTAQQPLWDRLRGVAEQEAQQERRICDQMKPGGAESIVDRMDAEQQLLSARVAGLQAAKEPLAALYQALSPEQRAMLDRPLHRPWAR